MGCSPSHALIINSSTRPQEPICLQPRIYMVSESTLRILEDVGELRLYQQEDKDPGIARVRFGTSTLDQLENPVGFQTQLKRQYSIDSEKSIAVKQDSKITFDVGITEEDEDSQKDGKINDEKGQEKDDSLSCLTGQSSAVSSTVELVTAQIHTHQPSPLKTLAKNCVDEQRDDENLLDVDRDCQLQSLNSSYASL